MEKDKVVTVSIQVQANPNEGGTLFSMSVPAMLSELLESGAVTPGAITVIDFLVKAKNTI